MAANDKHRPLTEREIAEYWENFTGLESEVEGDFSDTDSLDDPTFVPGPEDDIEQVVSDIQESENVMEEGPSKVPQERPNNRVNEKKKKSALFKNITWRHKELILNEDQLRFHGNSNLNDSILRLETPYQFFSYFFDEIILRKIVEETNLYAVQKKPERPPVFSTEDIRQFLGIILYMSLVRMPSVRSYWSEKLEFLPIKNTMTVNKFEKIRQYIHFNDNNCFIPRDQPGHDRLFKIRPILDALNEKFSSVPMEQHLSLDEQMCSTKVRHYMKQFMPLKPHKWGFKLFVLAGASGYAYKFEIYSGQETSQNNEEENNLAHLGTTGNIVIRLAKDIPRNENYRLYHDNYYTSLPLMTHLAKEGIYSLGTVRRNRIPNCKLPAEATLKTAPRGTCQEFISCVDGVDISSVIWKDNKYVTLLSSFVGKQPLSKVNRYDRKEKKVVQVDCPSIIREYNKHMGGVDLLDSNMGRYKIFLKSRKWYLRIFYHLVDLSVVNAWFLYKRACQQKGVNTVLKQADFRSEIAETLTKIGTAGPSKRGRPSSLEQEIASKRKRGPTQHVPPKEIRTDQIGHWSVFENGKMRCKYPLCKGYTYTHTKCEKCGVALCFTKIKNCFRAFHTE